MAVDEFSDYPDTGASGSQEYTSPEDPSIEFTSKNPRGDYDPPQPDADYGVGATGNVSTSARTSSGGGTGAPFIHPFKLQKVTNPEDNSTKVRVYEGDVYAKIDTFQLDLISLTTSVQSYSTADPPAGPLTKEASLGNHSITFSDVTAQMPQHQHDVDGGAVYIPQHKHLARDSSEDGLVMPNHKHSADTLQAQAGNTSGTTGAAGAHSHTAGSYEMPDHSHDQGGSAEANSSPTTGNTSAAGSHSRGSGSYVIPDHTHKAQEGSNKLLIPQHTHLPRNGSEDGLVMPNHTHGAGGYAMPDHTHNQGGTAAAKTGTDITEGDTGSGTDHTHSISGLTTTVAEHSHSSQGTVSGTDQKLTIKEHTHLPRNGSEDGLVMPNHTHQYNKDDHSHDVTGNTASGTAHTHSITGLSAPMGDHYHTSGGTGTGSDQQLKFKQHTHLPRNSSSEDGLVMPDHEHEAGTDSGNLKIPQHQHEIGISGNTGSVVGSGGSYPCDDTGHYHQVYIKQQTTNIGSTNDRSVEGETDGVKGHGTDASKKRITGNTGNVVGYSGTDEPEHITGNTGGIAHSHPSQSLSGSLGSESDHSHPLSSDVTAASKSGSSVTVGDTTEVKDYNTDSEKRITGNTGNVETSSSSALEVTGNTGGLSTSTSTAITGTSETQADHQHTYNKDDHSHNLTGQTGSVDSSDSKAITGSSSTESAHTHSYTKDDHTHSVTGDTTEVTDYSASGGSERKVTGETGSVKDYSTEANKKCTGTTGDVRDGSSSTLPSFTISVSGSSSSSGLDHSHNIPALESASTTHKFVAVKGQEAAPAAPEETNFTATFNKKIKFEDGTDTIFSYHESSHSSGDFYVKWEITIDADAKIVANGIVGSIERVAVGAGAPADVPFGALTQNGDKELVREEAKRKGTFHQKIGSVSGNTVDQKQFSNINWSMTVLPEVSSP